MRPSLLGLTRSQLEAALASWADRPYRIEQVYRALHERRVRSFDEITDLSRPLRQALADAWSLERPAIVERVRSRDGSRKYLFSLADGATIEAVYIPEGRRRTLCLSSQAGCALGCTFCVTGYWGAGRNLTAGEIVGQVEAIETDLLADAVTSGAGAGSEEAGAARVQERERREREVARGLNLVFMGMGEPLLNLGALRDALEIVSERISWRRITVSTVGVIPGIEQLLVWHRRPNLAVSLHAPDDELRSRLVPLNRRYPIANLLAVLRRYPQDRFRRLTFEYTLIRGLNDALEHAAALPPLLRGLRCKVNLIPLNPDPVLGDLAPPPRSRVLEFQRRVIAGGLACSIRRARGDDVKAACGQLRAFGREPRGRHG